MNITDTNEQKNGLVPVLACVLKQLCLSNDQMPFSPKESNSKFHALRIPFINLKEYLERITKYSGCSTECLVLALVYIDRIIQGSQNFIVNSYCIHRLLVTSVMLAAKFFDDHYYNNAYYAKVGGVTYSEMNSLEVDFLFMLNFDLFVTTETYKQYYDELWSHANSGPARVCGCIHAKVPLLILPRLDEGRKTLSFVDSSDLMVDQDLDLEADPSPRIPTLGCGQISATEHSRPASDFLRTPSRNPAVENSSERDCLIRKDIKTEEPAVTFEETPKMEPNPSTTASFPPLKGRDVMLDIDVDSSDALREKIVREVNHNTFNTESTLMAVEASIQTSDFQTSGYCGDFPSFLSDAELFGEEEDYVNRGFDLSPSFHPYASNERRKANYEKVQPFTPWHKEWREASSRSRKSRGSNRGRLIGSGHSKRKENRDPLWQPSIVLPVY